MARITLFILLLFSQAEAITYYGANFWPKHNVSYGEDPLQTLDIFAPVAYVGEPNWLEPRQTNKPLVIFIHGGGWIMGDKLCEPVFSPFLQQGYPVVSLNYRIGPGTAPAAPEDVLLALAWLAEHGKEYHIDPSNVVLTGLSAGGHLSLYLGLAAHHPNLELDHTIPANVNVKAIVNWAGITDMGTLGPYLAKYSPEHNYFREWVGDESKEAEIALKYSPVNLVHEKSPPVLTIHGEKDLVVPFDQALDLDRALTEKGIPHQMYPIPEGNHLGWSQKQYEQAFLIVFDFLEQL